ncbi:hypothetical protein D3C87_2115590 [compost metagenome]
MDVHFAQHIFVTAADGEHAFALAWGKLLHLRTDALEQRGLIPAQRLIQFGLPGALVIVF